MILNLIDAATVVAINEMECAESGNPIGCPEIGKVESALHAAFYPGSYPFVHGEISEIAGALAFYICQAHAFIDGNKKTAALAAIVLLNANGYDLKYIEDDSSDELSTLILNIASGNVDIAETKDWFKYHSH